MKTIMTVAIMGIVVSIAVGIVGVQAISESNSEIPSLSSSGLNILGHATFTVTDPDGNIKAYRQTDNAIITNGKDCVARFLFHNASSAPASNNCKDTDLTSGFTGFRHIGISNKTTVTTLTSAATLASDFTNDMATSGAFPRVTVTPTYAAASGTTGTIVSLTTGAQSITSAVGSTNVTTSALLDDTTVGSDHAAAIIAIPNGVSVASGDTLTVSWTVTVG